MNASLGGPATNLRRGDVMFGPIGGAVGALVGAGQMAIAPWKSLLSWKTWWRIRHAGVVTDIASGTVYIGQAMPSGFEIVPLRSDQWSSDYVFIRPRWLDDTQGDRVAHVTEVMESKGIGYSFIDYASIAAHRIHAPAPHLDDYIARTDADGYPLRSICSQAVDFALTRAGGLDGAGHVFDDGRLSQDVVPSELYVRLLQLDPIAIIPKGDRNRGAWRISHQEFL